MSTKLRYPILHLDLEQGRRFFAEQANVPPLVLDFHVKMIEMELEAPQKNIQLIRKNFDNACLLFGQQNIGKINLVIKLSYWNIWIE